MSRPSLPELDARPARRYLHDEAQVFELLAAYDAAPSSADLDLILANAAALRPLTAEDAVRLVRTAEDRDLATRVIRAADRLRRRGFGDAVKVYVPLYVSNY